MALQGPLGFYSFSAEVRPLCSPCLMVGPFPIKLVRAQLDVTHRVVMVICCSWLNFMAPLAYV